MLRMHDGSTPLILYLNHNMSSNNNNNNKFFKINFFYNRVDCQCAQSARDRKAFFMAITVGEECTGD